METDKLDGQGTPRNQLVGRAGGATGWDGVSYMTTYDGSETGTGWIAQEVWIASEEAPDVFTNGIGSLTIDETNAFVVNEDFSSITASEASVYSDRVWDSEDSGNGYAITSEERAFDFIGWYYVYEPTPCSGRLLQEETAEPEAAATAPKDWNSVCPTTIKGQSEEPQIFILGALSGLAVASAAILTTMLF